MAMFLGRTKTRTARDFFCKKVQLALVSKLVGSGWSHCMVITGLPRYVNEQRKLGIVIRHDKLCLTVDDQQVGSTLSVKHICFCFSLCTEEEEEEHEFIRLHI